MDLEGELNPAWRGGHKYWLKGKVGRDKDGLSWKQQRKLAWERDKYTCQDCGHHKDGWKPHCHHIIPYRLSFSHALDNLRSLCESCHKIAEAKIKELWGGHSFGDSGKKRVREVCKICEAGRRVLIDNICSVCRRKIRVKEARSLREKNLSYEEIAKIMGVTNQAVWKWVNII